MSRISRISTRRGVNDKKKQTNKQTHYQMKSLNESQYLNEI